ncbi:replication initiator [Phytoactinopolyspora endophytica]|uniref:replication initiator n=1 Tax=Phytoactinopolyspora endophytica TaxID=1642495 RepID=UPI00101DDA05|nr:replication initiator [Phytoactinopolyspora endophytica]
MSAPTLTDETLRGLAIAERVCVRPILSRLTDTETGGTRTVLIPCGSTRETVCPSCADRARRLRMQQCREGWHATEEPTDDDEENVGEDQDEDTTDDNADDEQDRTGRRVRSTRRRDDADQLPRPPKQDGTLGRTYVAPDGKRLRPSMFLTLTMPSYGRVTSEGVPVDPSRYDYRRAALDAIHFSKLIDRFWQNLRRATGVTVQYFATVEPQRRLAPHLHAAVRGTFPRALIRQVIAATYHQVWWPPHDEPVYVGDDMPAWDEHDGGYVDPDTGRALPTWDEALDSLDADPRSEPAHVVRFGRQVDMQGVLAGTPQADYAIGYLTKYLTKSISGDIDDAGEISAARQAHIDRLADEVRWLPCSPTCPNWLRFGVQPKHARAGMAPGYCRSKTHDRDHLGLGGRRVLVSRKWTGKTLTEHRADRAAVVRTVLTDAGIEMDDHAEFSATATRADGQPRYVWSTVKPGDADAPSYLRLIAAVVRHRQRWRAQYEHAKNGAGLPGSDLSATQPTPVADAA